MKRFLDLKIGTKLIVGFILVALLTGLVGFIGIQDIGKIQKADERLYKQNTQTLRHLGELSADYQRVRVNLLYSVVVHGDVEQYAKNISDLKSTIEESMTDIEAAASSEKARREYAQLRESFDSYLTLGDSLLEYAKADQDQEALDFIKTKIGPVAWKIDGALKKHYEVNTSQAKDRAETNQRIARTSSFMMAIFMAISMILAIVLGLILAKIISKPVKKLSAIADKLALGDVNVSIDAPTKDEIGDLMVSFGRMVENIQEQAKTADKIAMGDLNVDIRPRSEKDILAISMGRMIESLQGMASEVASLTKAAVEGRLDIRGNADKYMGGYREILQGINSTLDAVIGPLNVAAEYVDRISKGEIPAKINDTYYGDFNEIKNNLNGCIDAVNALVEDANSLAQAAIEGRLDARANASRHLGDFRLVIQGVNETLDAVIGPLNVAAEYVDRISKGDIPPKITDHYNGDFNEVKNNLNQCIDAVNALIEDSNMLVEAAVQGRLEIRAETSRHSGGFGRIVDGINKTLDAVIVPLNEAEQVLARIAMNDYTQEMSSQYQGRLKQLAESVNTTRTRLLSVQDAVVRASKGDTSRLDEFKKIGKRSENDQMMPSITGLYLTIQGIIDEVDMLSQAGINGALKVRGNVQQFEGGFRQIVEGFNHTLDAFVEPISEASSVLQEMAIGNLQIRVEGDYKGDHAALKDALNHAMVSFNDVLTEFNNAAEQVASGARNVSDSSQALSQGASEQAATVEEITAAMTEIAAQTKQNAVNANQANDLAMTAKDDAVQGNDQMKAMLGAMQVIQESSGNISKIIKVIDEIAFQTNILALNAAVEAARAGQHGKGFAVVAEEVRNLAARSANAAKETTVMIEGSIKKVEDGTRIASETATALNKIVDGVAKAAALVGNIATASNEQATGITQVNQGIAQVSQVTQTNTATSEQSAAASEELASQAELLKGMIRRFKLKDGESLNGKGMEMKSSISNAKFHTESTATGPVSKSKKVRISLDDQEFGKY